MSELLTTVADILKAKSSAEHYRIELEYLKSRGVFELQIVENRDDVIFSAQGSSLSLVLTLFANEFESVTFKGAVHKK